jgi:hypothetical protein
MSTIHEDGALRRSTRTRSTGRKVLGDSTNRATKSGADEELSGAAKKKPVRPSMTSNFLSSI